MTYRDEHEALRARLEATEQRLRETEEQLAEARRRLEEPPSLEPSTAPPPSRRVGHPPPARVDPSMMRTMLGAAGLLLALLGLGFVLWNLPAADHLGDVIAILLFAAVLFFTPGGLLVLLSVRPPRRAGHVTPPVLRARVAVSSLPRAAEGEGAAEADEDEDEDAGEALRSVGDGARGGQS